MAVSLIQSAPHRAVQYTASVLIVRYAFPLMHNCFCSRFLSTYPSERERDGERESNTCELIHTHKVPLCCSQTSMHSSPHNRHTYMHTTPILLALIHAHSQIHLHFELSDHSGLYIFSLITVVLCQGADLN